MGAASSVEGGAVRAAGGRGEFTGSQVLLLLLFFWSFCVIFGFCSSWGQ